ncbi:LysR substrate-binding domain-containing protein [Aliiruegeria haliotis]|nr:LysR substrate-binding domain-containing protein [Aliiruegeria haliotis]
MSRRLPPLRSLQAFEAIARKGTVIAAAEELSLTPSALSHRLRRLEEHLGVALFRRSNRRLVLSDAGREYLQYIQSAFDRIERSSDRLSSGTASDTLTVHCAPSFAPGWLLPRMGEFMAENPDIELRIHASPSPVDFFRTDTDVEIRYGHSDWAGLSVVQLMEDRIQPLCAPEVLAQVVELPARERLAAVPLILSERAPIQWAEWFALKNIAPLPITGPRFDRGLLSLQAAELGLGIALESRVFAERSLRQGTLVPVFDASYDMVAAAHTLVYPPAFGEVQKITRFRAWLLRAAGKTEAAFG